VASIQAAIESASVVLVLIGNEWLDARDQAGIRLLDRADDFVRIEVATALAGDKAVLPLLVEAAKMPDAADLPPDLRRLARQQALELSDTRWPHDVDRLVDAIRRYGVATPGPSSPDRRRSLLYAAGGLAAAIIVGGMLYQRANSVPELAGRWELPTGSFWIVAQDGRRLIIEETHYLSREVWKRGTGVIEDGAIRVSLDWAFDRMPPETGTLRLSPDGRTLIGELRVPDRDPAQARFAPAVLVRP